MMTCACCPRPGWRGCCAPARSPRASSSPRLARVDRLNPTVNALVTLDVEGASAAAAAEALIAEPMVLLDHVVGAGKSGSMLMGAMEL